MTQQKINNDYYLFLPSGVFVTFFLIILANINACANRMEEEEIFLVPEKMPELIGGIAELQKKVIYPDIARKNGIEGFIILKLVVDKQGIPTVIEVLQSLPYGLTQAAIEVVESHARFTPGIIHGKPVNVYFTIPIRFKLDN